MFFGAQQREILGGTGMNPAHFGIRRRIPALGADALWSSTEKNTEKNSHLIKHIATSEGMSKMSERANE